jgi:hypothetical protein
MVFVYLLFGFICCDYQFFGFLQCQILLFGHMLLFAPKDKLATQAAEAKEQDKELAKAALKGEKEKEKAKGKKEATHLPKTTQEDTGPTSPTSLR